MFGGRWDNIPSFFTGPVVTVEVGADKVVYTVHRNLICDASPFFEAAFMGSTSFKESSERTISQPEDDADIFDIFSEFLGTPILDFFGCWHQSYSSMAIWQAFWPAAHCRKLDEALGLSGATGYLRRQIWYSGFAECDYRRTFRAHERARKSSAVKRNSFDL